MTEWPITYRGAVYPAECDHVGHMNVAYYVAKFDGATWNYFAMIGMTPDYFRTQNRGMAAVQQNIAYKRELMPGDVVTVRTRLLEIRERVIRFEHIMADSVSGEVSATAEMTGVHLDKALRRACPFPDEILQRGRAMIGA
ncbi:MAG: thioesterase [Alphaproteobacteria bacterium]|nr:thioesterase [Alphaproteobacteria bacterium]